MTKIYYYVCFEHQNVVTQRRFTNIPQILANWQNPQRNMNPQPDKLVDVTNDLLHVLLFVVCKINGWITGES